MDNKWFGASRLLRQRIGSIGLYIIPGKGSESKSSLQSLNVTGSKGLCDVMLVLLALLEHPARRVTVWQRTRASARANTHMKSMSMTAPRSNTLSAGENLKRVTITICEIARSAREIRAHSTGSTTRFNSTKAARASSCGTGGQHSSCPTTTWRGRGS